ncbi:MAG: YjbE family putative metal transport protein [Deltaproteobacteria bacterium]|nr:YjbE family putative metal transport protein [Deltaproteobacteria bacterium]
MNWNSSDILWLLRIIGTNIVLSGDNAILVGMAVHRLPPHQRRSALVLGLSGSFVLQVLATLAVAQLLTIPLLLCVGGMLLCSIAMDLLKENEDGSPQFQTAKHLGHAVWIILVANLLMSLDNVLAVASVGQGQPTLILLGLLLSNGMLAVGSLFLSDLMNRYPFLITLGAGSLAWTAGRMIGTDVVIRQFVWVHLGADLQRGPLRFLMSALTTAVVMTIPSWRK